VALHWAAYRDDAAMTARLITAGADANIANRTGATPFTLACNNGSAPIVERLLAAGASPTASPSGALPLSACAASGSTAAVRLLIARGANVNESDRARRQTPLMWAAADNHAGVVRLLYEAGANIDARSSGNFTALMFAVRQNARESVRALLDAGADVNFAAPNGQTPLRLAINNRHHALALMLLDYGAQADTRDRTGNTPLHDLVLTRSPARHQGNQFLVFNEHEATSSESLALMKKLVSWGADPNARTEPERIVHERWTDKGIYSANRPFIDNGVNLGGATPYLLAAKGADVEAMRALQALGADPRLATYSNNTPLMVAAGIGYVEGERRYRPERDALEAVKLTLAAGVDVNATNANGQTALHGAVYRAANGIIKLLIESGARTEFQDELDRTPLKLAQDGFNQVASQIRRDSSAALLKQMGAKPPAPTPAMPKPPDDNSAGDN
jgi:ankyrin repeat protein